MERLVPALAKKPYTKLRHLIAIEYSRIVFNSYKSGQFIPLIDSLSRALNLKFGLGFVYYYKTLDLELKRFDIHTFRNRERFGDSSIAIFNELNDDFGLFMTKVNLHRSLTEKKRPLFLQEETINLHFRKSDSLFLIQSKELEREINGIVYRHRNDMLYRLIWNYNLARDLYKKSIAMDSSTRLANAKRMRSLLMKNIDLMNQNPQFFYLGFENYNIYANSYYLERNFNKCVENHLLCLNQYMHKESLSNQKLYTNLAGEYIRTDKKHKYDSAFYYVKKVLEITDESNITNHNHAYINFTLSEYYFALGRIDSAYKYLSFDKNGKSNIHLEALLKNYASSIDYELLREQDKINIKLKNENDKAILRNWFMEIILIIVMISTFLLYKLYKKTKKAEVELLELKAMRESFYAILAHDLRSPVDAYQGLANSISYLIKKGDYDRIYQLAVHIDNTGAKLKNLLGNLFNWSLEQKNYLTTNLSEVNITELVENILLIYQEISTSKDLKLHFNSQEALYHMTDRNMMSTIVRNIIDNAVKNASAMSEIYINLKPSNGSVGFEFSCTNTADMPADKWDLIYELYTTKNNWQPGYKGLGLGLILIRDFSEKLGLKVEVSRSDSEFCVKLISSTAKIIQV
jgi:signal transduction histidine kinase